MKKPPGGRRPSTVPRPNVNEHRATSTAICREIWVPRPAEVPYLVPSQLNNGGFFFQAVARLRPDVSLEQAREAMNVIAAGYRAAEVGKMFGRIVPMMVMSHQYILFEEIPELAAWSRENGRKLPLLRDVERCCAGRRADHGARSLPEALVENEIFANKAVFQPSFLDLLSVFYDAAFELKHVGETFSFHEGRGFLAPDASGAKRDDRLRLELGR